GSFVRVEGTGVDAVYGIVAFAETGTVDPGRRVVRRGSTDLRDRALYEANPELRFVLRSLFVAVAIAYEAAGRLVYLVPPYPPPLHYSVSPVQGDEIRRLTATHTYLAMLLDFVGPIPCEQLLAAHLLYVYRERRSDRDWLEQAAQEIARLTKRDHDRSRRILLTLETALGPELQT
ncbi:MAG: hypothetical protein NZL87_00390, partial [Thermomicrobium sp.]|nr:hypothetical protein [Thermomicrobium sp.]